MPNPITEAFVSVRPDFTGFAASAQAQAAVALRGIQTPVVGQGAVAASAVAATQATIAQTAATVDLTAASGPLASAQAAVASAQARLISTTQALTALQARAGVTAEQIAAAEFKQVAAVNSLAAAQSRLAVAQVASNKSLFITSDAARVTQGTLQGLGQGVLSSRLAFFGLAGAATALTASLGVSAIKSAADLEQSLNTLGVVTRATKDELEAAGDVSRQLGADITLPAVSATDGAEAILALARSGIALEDAMDGARGVLQLAAAAQTDNATAAVVTARALNAFNLAGREATHVADLLTGASIAGGQSIEETAVALQQSAAAAAQVNVSLSDTTNALALLARNGLAGSDAGTSLRTALLRLNPATKEARELTRALGVEVFDAEGNFLGLPNAIEQYRQALEGLSEEQRQAALSTIFGQDAFRAISILSREGAAGFEQIAKQAEREGIAAEVAAARTSGLKGAFSALASQTETLGTNLGALAIGPLTEVVRAMSDVVTAANQATEAIKSLGDIKIPELEVPGTDFEIPGAEIGDIIKDAADVAVPQFKRIIAESLPVVGPIIQLKNEVTDLGRRFGLFKGQAEDASARTVEFTQALGNLQTSARNLIAPFQAALTQVAKPVEAGDIQADLQALRRTLAEEGVAVGEGFVKNLQAKLATLDPREALDLVRKLNKAVAIAKASGQDVGEAFGLAMADGVRSTQVEAVRSAQETLNEVIRAGQEAVKASVLQAKQNLFTIGSQLATDAVELIQNGPLGQEVERLQNRISGRDLAGDRRRASNELKKANKDLANARKAVSGEPLDTPAQREQIGAFLQPFKDKVLDAKDAVADLDDKSSLEKLQDRLATQTEKIGRDIDDVIAKVNAGLITAPAAIAAIGTLIGKRTPNFTEAGAKLGVAFRLRFKEELDTLNAQIRATVGFANFPGAEGSGQGGTVVRPGETQAEANQRAAKAREDLIKAQGALGVTISIEHQNDRRIFELMLDELEKLNGKNGKKPGIRKTGDPDLIGPPAPMGLRMAAGLGAAVGAG